MEETFTDYLQNEAIAAGHRETTAQQNLKKKSSLRYRLACIKPYISGGCSFNRKFTHELILEQGHKFGVLHPSVDRIRKQLHLGRITTPTHTEILFPKICTPNVEKIEVPAKICEKSIFHYIASYLQAIYSDFHGRRMGKYLQFQDRFQKCALELQKNLEDKLKIINERQKTILGDSLIESSLITFNGMLNPDDRLCMQSLMMELVLKYFPVDPIISTLNFELEPLGIEELNRS
ncbi:hypothetical protein HK096_011040, partial [Nowakowskiella sp. JEL0078]